MSRDLLQCTAEYCEREQLLMPGEPVVAGVSGGADSICLLQVLYRLGYQVTAVHVHHGIRSEAEEDAAYVRDFCVQRNIPCRIVYEDVPGYAKEHGMSEEEAGRVLRYQVFEQVRREIGARRIAVAHHRDDQAETLLWNLFRGSGITGLTGMFPLRGKVIRPLLQVSREEIESYLKEQNICWQTDSTNLQDTYTRNRIRNRLLPEIREKINAQAVLHIAETAGELQQVEAYLQKQTEEAWKRCVTEEKEYSGYVLHREAWLREEIVLRRRLLKLVLEQTAGRSKDLTRRHVEILEQLLESQVGRAVDLPYGCEAKRIYEGLLIRKRDAAPEAGGFQEEEGLREERRLQGEERFQGEVSLQEEKSPREVVKGRLVFRHVDLEQTGEPWTAYTREKQFTKYFDYDIITQNPVLRLRQTGDYLIIDEKGGRQKLKQYFINEKIPASLRTSIPLVTIGQEVLWAVGYRMGERGKITEKTKHVLCVTYQPTGDALEGNNGSGY